VAQALSCLGDQVAQVSIAVLVYARTGSPWLTALAYSLTYLPTILGWPLLSGLADVVPRWQLMITLDLARCGLLTIMTVPWVPLPWLGVLLFAVVALGPPFSAARSGLLRQVLPRHLTGQAAATQNAVVLASQPVGFLVGGVLVGAFGAHRGLAVDALSFCLSAGVLAQGVRPRPLPSGPPQARPSLPVLVRDGGGVIVARPLLRTLVLLGWLAGFAVVPEGLAVPYAATLRGGPVMAGLLMAVVPAGMVLGSLLMRRLARPDEQQRLTGWLAVLSCAPLAASMLRPPLWLLLPAWALAGLGGAYQFQVARAFLRAVPAATRAQAFAAAQAGLLTVQGLGILLAGAVAARLGAPAAVAAAGAAGTVSAAWLAAAWARYREALPAGQAGARRDATRRNGGWQP
jgi:hypothetical protein